MSQQHIKIITYQVKVDFIPEVFNERNKRKKKKTKYEQCIFFFFFKYAAAKSL